VDHFSIAIKFLSAAMHSSAFRCVPSHGGTVKPHRQHVRGWTASAFFGGVSVVVALGLPVRWTPVGASPYGAASTATAALQPIGEEISSRRSAICLTLPRFFTMLN